MLVLFFRFSFLLINTFKQPLFAVPTNTRKTTHAQSLGPGHMSLSKTMTKLVNNKLLVNTFYY